MKPIILLFACASLVACHRPASEHGSTHERPPENGAQFKEREGIALTEPMKKSIGIEVADVEEAKVAPEFNVPLHVLGASSGSQPVALSAQSKSASGWLTAAQAEIVKRGDRVTLTTRTGITQGTVRSVEKSAYAVAGEFEVVVDAEHPMDLGSRVLATFRGADRESAAAIPQSALLKTAEGSFVYVLNGERYVRTPVKIGAENPERAEIADGLYAGDQVVTRGVKPLWLAELQVLRGGKACTCGH